MSKVISKVIFILLDGLRFDVAQVALGYLGHLVEVGQASFYRVQAELPSVSRPCYEVLMTGTPSSVNGITSNQIARLSNQISLFHLVQRQGRTTAAAAYYFFSELYNSAPFNRVKDREQHDPEQPIQHGRFYWDDAYPDSHLFADAEALRRDYDPDFMVVHPGGIDHAGHQFGGESREYRNQAIAIDDLLAQFLPLWISEYQLVITADHGMNADGQHGGTSVAEREVPLFCISPKFQPGVYDELLPQLAIAPMVCRLLGLTPTEQMRPISIPEFNSSATGKTFAPLNSQRS
jgi:predicted AlkP superfamily pyrophosphatase or phosphodiesterase